MIAKAFAVIKGYFKKKSPEYKRDQFGSIGPHCIIGSNSKLVPSNIFMEDYSVIQGNNNFISYKGKLIIKKYSVISAGCIIIPSNHVPTVGIPFYGSTLTHIGDDDNEIVVEEDAWVGAGCILLPHCKIGRGCIIGAGSIVTKDIPPYAVAVGSPAKIVGVKFSKDDIIKHEEKLYEQTERFTTVYLEELFNRYFRDVHIVDNHILNSDEDETYRQFSQKYGIK